MMPSARIYRGEGGERGGGGGEWSVSFEQFIASVLTESALVDHFSVPLDIKVPVTIYSISPRDTLERLYPGGGRARGVANLISLSLSLGSTCNCNL